MPFSFLNSTDSITPQNIVVWVHGTRTHEIFPPTYVVHKKTKTLAEYSPYGLHSLLSIDPDLHVSLIGQAIHKANKAQYHKEHIYLFGWSGGFTPEARTLAGKELSEKLSNLTELYTRHYGACPPITLITHSHGGNVALECVPVSDHRFTIEKLILLACPVQEKTKPYTLSPVFKQIYSIHSEKDYFQILDMQGFHPVWQAFEMAFKSVSIEPIKHAWHSHNKSTKILSERHFPHQPNLKQGCAVWKTDTTRWSTHDLSIMEPFLSKKNIEKLQEKLISFDSKERGLMHIEFLFPTFLHRLPDLLEMLDNSTTPDMPKIQPTTIVRV